MKGKLRKKDGHYYFWDDNFHITDFVANTTEHSKNKLSLKNCEAIANGYDLDELVEDFIVVKPKYREHEHNISVSSFKVGFQKALEILGDKKFSEEDVAFMFQLGFNLDNPISRNEYDAHIQSLQQTEWDVEIEMEKVIDETKIIGAVKGVKGSGNKITTYKQIPKLDADGCLILKRI